MRSMLGCLALLEVRWTSVAWLTTNRWDPILIDMTHL
jgi:hypothetical protein